jgi:hypothetical protein
MSKSGTNGQPLMRENSALIKFTKLIDAKLLYLDILVLKILSQVTNQCFGARFPFGGVVDEGEECVLVHLGIESFISH